MFVVSELTGNIYKNGVLVPADENNLDYQEFLLAVQNGEVQSIPYTAEEFAQNIIIQAIRDERNAHANRIIDGHQKYSELVSRLRIAEIQGTITNSQYNNLKVTFEPIRADLISGDWKEALVKMEGNLSVFQSNSIESIYTTMRDSMIEYIMYNYVTYNLEVPEVTATKLSEEKAINYKSNKQ